MALQAGTRLDAYEILGLLGAGGMGEVYQARDTRLDRIVALKILPSEVTADGEASARFEREARTLASISHPHVCSLFELTQHERRSWAFGCVLYEMVTGGKVFDGATPASVIAMILDRDPQPPSALEPIAAGALDRVIQKCLAKDPDARWQTALDLRDELKWIGDGVAALPAPRLSGRQRWSYPLTGALMGAAIAIAALLVWRPWGITTSEATVSRLELTVPRLALHDSFALSPDGRQLAFLAPDVQGRNIVWVRSLAETTPRQLPGTDGAHPGSPPFWSPDGRSLAFVSGNKLKKIDVAGGDPVTLADVTGELMGGSWGIDGTLIVGTQQFSKTHGVHTVSAAGGKLEPLVGLQPGALIHLLPKFLPDGRRFLYMTWGFDEGRREICVASLDDAVGRCLGIKAHYFGGFTPDGYLAYARNDTLFAQAFDLVAVQPAGEPVVIAEQLSHDSVGRTSLSIAGASTLVYQAAPPEIRQFVWVDRRGRHLAVAGEPGAYDRFDIAADGKHILAERTEAGGTGLWLIDVARGVTTKAVSPSADDGASSIASYRHVFTPVFSGDGQRFFYQTRRTGRAVILEQATRGGNERLSYGYSGDGVLYLADASDDGRWLAIGVAERGRRYAAVVPRTGGDPIVFAEGALVGLPSGRLSPDGRWVAYASAESGRAQVYVSPLPPSGERWQVSTAGGTQPAWRGDGLEFSTWRQTDR